MTDDDQAADDRLTALLRAAIRPAEPKVTAWTAAAEPPTREEWRAMLQAAVSRPYEPPVIAVHPAAWDAHVAGECTCRWVFPAPCAVHQPEAAASSPGR